MRLKKGGSLIFFSLILIFISAACETFREERTYSKNGLTVTYRSLNRLGGGIENYSIRHPINIPKTWVKNHLLALWYSKIEPPEKAKPVFSSEAADNLSSLLVQAFEKVKPGKYLHFEFQSSKGMTTGDVFASVGKIHWHLLKINDVAYSNDPLRLRKPTWKLVRMHGQVFHKVSTAISVKSQENWLLTDLKTPKIKRSHELPSSFNIPQKKIKAGALKQKLKTLKNLFDEGLIDESEYRKKKREVLNQNF